MDRARTAPQPGELAREALLARFAPPAVLIDRRFRVLYFHGTTGRYLRQPAGEPTDHLLDLAREGLRAPLLAAMRRASAEDVPVEVEGWLNEERDARRVRVSVAPIGTPRQDETCFLVSFAEIVAGPDAAADGTRPARLSRQEIEAAVQATRAEMSAAVAELEAVNEELAAANTRLRHHVTALETRTTELEALLDGSTVALLSLDAQGCIRAFTPALSSLLRVRPVDVGRPIGDLAAKFHDPDFEADRARVAETGLSAERDVEGEDGRWYLRRILPRRGRNERADGVVVVFLDITVRRQAEENLRAATDLAQRIIAATGEPLLLLDAERRVRLANPAFCANFGYAAQEVEGRSVFEIGEGAWEIPELRRLLDLAQDSPAGTDGTEMREGSADCGQRSLWFGLRPLDGTDLVLLAIRDITERKESERRQQVLVTELQHRVKNILANVGALIDLTRQRSTSLDAFVSALEGRLRAMSRIQDLLTQRDHEPVYLRDLLQGELEAQGMTADTPELSVEGADLRLDARTAQGLGMALHELTTNAAKYGAFSASGGHTDISWAVIRAEGGPHLLFRWRESGIAMPATPPQKGFGAELIEAAVPYMLHGRARLDFRPDGVQCIIEVPLPGDALTGELTQEDRA